MNFDPIGHIESCYRERFGTPRQPGLVPDSWAILKLRPELNLSDALYGLDGFSHLWVIFVFHLNTNKGVKTRIHPPRMNGESIGVFATRAPHRPNPIGLSVVKIEKIEGNNVYLSGVDFVDGTPVLDIKPYHPQADAISNATGGWTESRDERTVTVSFDPKVEELIATLGKPNRPPQQLRSMIEKTLELDPRPGFYKGTPDNPDPYMDAYGFCIEDYNVVYKMNGSVANVIAIEPIANSRKTPKT